MPDQKPTLKKSLGVFDGIAILVGITIGAGIYSTPQIIAGYQSSFLTIGLYWLLAGVFVFIGGLIYAELGSRFPSTGGEYVYLQKAFGPITSFIFGWAQLFIVRTSPAAGLSIIAVNYIAFFVEISQAGRTLLAIVIIIALGYLNYTGVSRAGFYQRTSTIIKVAGLFLLTFIGLLLGSGQENLLFSTAPPTAELGPIGNAAALMMLIVFSFLGWDRVGYVAGEMRNPKRVLPITMFAGIGAVVIIYLLTNIMYHQVLGIEGVRASTIVASDAAAHLMGPAGASFVAIIVIISTTGSINGTMMTATRVYYAMARDKLFFKWFDYIHPQFGTPSRAVIAHCGWAVVILLVRSNFESIVSGMTFAILCFYAFSTLAFFKFRMHNSGDPDGYRVPFYPLLPGIYLAGILSLILIRIYYEWQASLTDLAFVATGVPFAFIFCRKLRTNHEEGNS